MLPLIPWGLGVVGVVCFMLMDYDERDSQNGTPLLVMVIAGMLTGFVVFAKHFPSVKFFDAHVEAIHWGAGGIMLVLGIGPLIPGALNVYFWALDHIRRIPFVQSIVAMRENLTMRISEDE